LWYFKGFHAVWSAAAYLFAVELVVVIWDIFSMLHYFKKYLPVAFLIYFLLISELLAHFDINQTNTMYVQ